MKSPDFPSRTQDEWIVLRCQSGEESAFEDLIRLMQRPLLYYATEVTGNPEMGLDVLQDVWLKVFREIRRLQNPSSLRPWLYGIAHGIAVGRTSPTHLVENDMSIQFFPQDRVGFLPTVGTRI